jgi:RNA polymerase sigma-70 factor, ECF subfamily
MASPYWYSHSLCNCFTRNLHRTRIRHPPPRTLWRGAACESRCALACQGLNFNVLPPRRSRLIPNFDRNLSPPRQFYTMAATSPENSLKAAQEASERRLIEAAQQDPSRFAALYEIHFERVYAYVSRRLGNREAAEDVTSEVFQHALANLPRFEWRGAPFGSWLMRIASNAIADRWRRGARERSQEFASDPASAEPSPEEIEIRAQLFRRVQQLPIEQRKVLQMRFAEEKSIREIAHALGRTAGAIKQLQFRGMQTLREEAARVSGKRGAGKAPQKKIRSGAAHA